MVIGALAFGFVLGAIFYYVWAGKHPNVAASVSKKVSAAESVVNEVKKDL